MNPIVNAISNRLSLRAPQRESLEILDRVCESRALDQSVSGGGDIDLAQALETIKGEFPTVTDFERDFPSLCFALATGVGKTRLMGAFISYLHRIKLSRHFFVLAPNLTIYNKLIADFSPNTPKYVFEGIAEFATNRPEIITGDNYESGRGIRAEDSLQARLFDTSPIHVNIFNISKINSEVRGGKPPRIKRLSEYIGESYFEYLAGLKDLVLLMDESHRYRASAGVRAINELKPILGLELTATPQIERNGTPESFKNIIFSYPLSSAMNDGFVKEPAVATRENFNVNNYNEDSLEKLKLEDGVRVHENTKVELEVYARDNGKPIVKPFILVVAKDTSHADDLRKVIEADDFFGGRYKGKVITVHSNLRGDEKDETVQQLLSVEDRDNSTEIVIHVNMLKEGWDVTNLYTIVPLRAANSKTLVEQSIGRGLRLPYGGRVGISAVDRLTIVSHDKFQEIIDEANRPDSIIRTGVVIGRDIPDKETKAVEVCPLIMTAVTPATAAPEGIAEQKPLFDTEREREVARATLMAIRPMERLARSADLKAPENIQKLVERVKAATAPAQGVLEGAGEQVNVEEVVTKTVDLYVEKSIDIPKIVVVPKGEVTAGYSDFGLDLRGVQLQPVAKDILIAHLHDHSRYRLVSGDGIAPEARLEDYLVRGLMDFDDISYDDHAELLYKLAGQVVDHLKSYLANEDDVINVLQYHQDQLVEIIHLQMQDHYEEKATEYEVHVTRGFTTLRPNNYSIPAGEAPRSFRVPIDEKLMIRGMLFGGFRRCLYPAQRFQSDSERRFSVILEDDPDVLKWFKPGKGDFQIRYKGDIAYEPDFVVETKTAKLICEPKRASEMKDKTVLAKADAAAVWCEHASRHEQEHAGKPWSYLLIPDEVINEAMTLQGLCAAYTVGIEAGV
ncbi:MAG: type III restriction endonuclease subunit R [Acidobacteria bacterium]|nr:MAG: type III restriction endonuclease subunit R [Acidobacteriota bacterium]